MRIEFDEYRLKLEGMKSDIEELARAISLDGLKAEVADIEEQSAVPGFWDDLERSQRAQQRLKQLSGKIERYGALYQRWEDALTLVHMAIELEDEEQLDEIISEQGGVAAELETQRLETLLTGEYDSKNAILTFHPGAGGTEAQDWAQMLYRMYTRWAERQGFTYKILDYLDGDEAGIKSAAILITGENAYGYLKGELGVHRLVRISPFDSSGRRHTSFASVEVMPQFDDTIKIEIKDEDLRVDTYRASGAGGQHVNKTESAIRITHLPTGIVVACQNERSQHQNRDTAMTMLKSKLMEIKERERLDKIEDIKGDQREIAWGSQIRSYVFMPYTLAKDHRTNFEAGNIGAVMDGDIDGFINAYLKSLTVS